MLPKQESRVFSWLTLFGCAVVAMVFLGAFAAQPPAHYEPTLESLNQHPLPQWYADAKQGIFIHWGLYSVPGWAPLVHPTHDFKTYYLHPRAGTFLQRYILMSSQIVMSYMALVACER
jgi:Alpha-L-fucosidase